MIRFQGLHLLFALFKNVISFLFLDSYTIFFFCVRLFHYAAFFKSDAEKGLQTKTTFILSFVFICVIYYVNVEFTLLIFISSCGFSYCLVSFHFILKDSL